VRTGRTDWVQFILNRFIWFIILGVFLFFAVRAKGFLTGLNMINILLHASVLGLMTIGQAICLFSGNFDLSAEGTVSLVTVLAGWMMVPAGWWEGGGGWELHPLIVIPIILLIGAVVGWLNGLMITRLGMNNFIVTLAMQLVLRGIALFICKGFNISGLPPLFRWLGNGKIGPIPVQIIVTGLAFVGFHLFLGNSSFGRQLYAVGGNKDAARASGFNPEKTITIAYIISGFLAAVAGWMLVGRVGESVSAVLGSGLTLETVAAAVIGGVALQGGYGSIGGAFAGVMLLSIVGNGLNVMEVDPFWVNGIRGFIILVALLIEAQKFRYKPKVAQA
jgi:ribose/xylose/arabinose/galactoside ABC-type transport system permease subunit